MTNWVIIGVPSSAGAHHAGQDSAPAALRKAGLPDRLRAAGLKVDDAGDLPGAVFAVDREHPHGRNLPAVAQVARASADAVAGAIASGRRPLVVGGDCTITLGVIAGFRRRHPDVGLVYLDGDADLGTPQGGGSGIFDSMGITHLLGGGAPELAGLAGRRCCWRRPGWRSSAPTRGRPTTPAGNSWPGRACGWPRHRSSRRIRPASPPPRSRTWPRPAGRSSCTSTWT